MGLFVLLSSFSLMSPERYLPIFRRNIYWVILLVKGSLLTSALAVLFWAHSTHGIFRQRFLAGMQMVAWSGIIREQNGHFIILFFVLVLMKFKRLLPLCFNYITHGFKLQ